MIYIIFPSITQDQATGMRRGELLLYHTGLLVFKYVKKIESSCKTNVANYPFDKQECLFKFGSWAYHGFDIYMESRDKVYCPRNNIELYIVSVNCLSKLYFKPYSIAKVLGVR